MLTAEPLLVTTPYTVQCQSCSTFLWSGLPYVSVPRWEYLTGQWIWSTVFYPYCQKCFEEKEKTAKAMMIGG